MRHEIFERNSMKIVALPISTLSTINSNGLEWLLVFQFLRRKDEIALMGGRIAGRETQKGFFKIFCYGIFCYT